MTPRTPTAHRPPRPPRDEVVGRPFHTPVRGHGFSHRPTGGAPLPRGRLRLRREPGNPADPWAVAIWVEGGGVPWRAGYLERAVAARIGPRLDAASGERAGRAGQTAGDPVTVPAAFAGWAPGPDGAGRRPLVRVGSDEPAAHAAPSVRELPPYGRVRRWPSTAAGGRAPDVS